jgi:hypothetical protein
MKFGKLVGGFAMAALLCFAAPGSANVWVETGSAGDVPATAQDTLGNGPLTEILGNLDYNVDSSIYEVDLYRIRITDASSFSAATTAGDSNVSDPVLWLFDAAGHGIYMNDDISTSPANTQSNLPPTHPLGPVTPGYYLLGVSWTFYDAISDPSNPFSSIFPAYLNTGDTSGIYGPGNATDVLAGWTPDSPRQDLPAQYDIRLTGATFAIPEPGTLTLIGLTLLMLMVSLRRRS